MFLPKKISLPPYVFYMLGKTTISFTVTYFQRAFSPGEVYQRIYLDSSAGKIIVFFSEQEFHKIWENPVFIKFSLLAKVFQEIWWE